MANWIMEDGFPTRVRFLGNDQVSPGEGGPGTLAAYAALPAEFNATTITPPAYDLGGENDVTSMENNYYRTKAAKRLVDLTTISMEGFYSPQLYTDLLGQLGKNQQIEITFPPEGVGDGPENPASVGRTVTFYGFLDKFTPGAHEEGSPPTATFEIVVTNRDLDGNEAGPTVSVPANRQ